METRKLQKLVQGLAALLLALLLAPAVGRAAALSAEDAKLLKAGKRLFDDHCGVCHETGGDNDIRKRTEKVATVGLEAYITGQGRIFEHMPLFEGSAKDRRAIALYVTVDLNHKAPDERWVVEVKPLPMAVPAFNPKTDAYVLLAWNTLGMKCITDCDGSFSFLPPGNAMGAVLIKRGAKPQLVSAGVEMAYAAPADARNPSAHVEFWRYAPSILGKELPLNVTAAGKGPEGVMAYNEKSKTFEAAGLPVTPYVDGGGVNPYPLFTVTAKDTATGKVLAQTQAVAPVGAEMGCRSCHGGPWRTNNSSGISEETARNILAVHDKRSGTTLLAQAQAGKPMLCQGCHPDPLLNAKGDPARLNLPAAMHGFHANYLSGRGEETCSRCHPDSPTGVTRCLRDNHASKGIGCGKCHGLLEDHTIGLLKGELAQGKQRAGLFLRHLKARSVASAEVIKARTPWLQEPDCLTCHTGKGRPKAAQVTAFNAWMEGGSQLYRNRKEDTGNVPCIACHSSPHATYPAANAYGKNRDNVQPLQYMGFAGPIGARQRCEVCHTQAMKNEPHHKAMFGR
jgi:mono/diheme cytochrome c family protein